MTEAAAQPPSEFVQFWKEILVPKFIRYKHVLVGGLTKHSDAIFPKLEVNEGERVLDAGAGFGDTAIMLAKRVASLRRPPACRFAPAAAGQDRCSRPRPP